ncbi:hypothetical protein BH11ARM2_BH11ARM2_28950 [soil metagenome]
MVAICLTPNPWGAERITVYNLAVHIGRIERVPLREVWTHEAYDFTTWHKDNLDVVNDATGLSLGNALHEQSAGSFSVDLVAEDEKSGGTAVIENQFGKRPRSSWKADHQCEYARCLVRDLGR